MALLIQYFKKGWAVVAKNFRFLLCRIKVVIFHPMINTPMANPTMAVLMGVTASKYSGARYKLEAPKVAMKFPVTVAKRIYQNNRSTWYFLKCNKHNCTGKENHIPTRYFFMKVI
jgi:hypothetical protein